jgi:hypothetical protein
MKKLLGKYKSYGKTPSGKYKYSRKDSIGREMPFYLSESEKRRLQYLHKKHDKG